MVGVVFPIHPGADSSDPLQIGLYRIRNRAPSVLPLKFLQNIKECDWI